MAARRIPPLFLFSRDVPSACFVLDEDQLVHNAGILDRVQKTMHVRILLALKSFACFALFPLLSRAFDGPLYGTCASSVDEARLGREEFGGEVHSFACAFEEEELTEILAYSDHVVFNSLAQWNRHRRHVQRYAKMTGRMIHVGLRINPEHSEGTVAMYDPCHPSSRLGIRFRDFQESVLEEGISGLHFHTLCEQGADALWRTLVAMDDTYARYFGRCSWINMGGGHHITRADYDLELLERSVAHVRERAPSAEIYLEPGEAVALDAGWLTATVLDIVEADLPVVIMDVSPACHMPDTLEMPYSPPVLYLQDGHVREALPAAEDGETTEGWTARLAGKSCLAGDVLPEPYRFSEPLTVGSRLVFGDMAIYTMVKTNTFNGLRLPSIGRFTGTSFREIASFGYEDFKERLS